MILEYVVFLRKVFFLFVLGLVIQWGMIGDVGVVVEKFGNKVIVVGGILRQRMFFCLDFMDQFFCQFKLVVFSFVLFLVLMEGWGIEI